MILVLQAHLGMFPSNLEKLWEGYLPDILTMKLWELWIMFLNFKLAKDVVHICVTLFPKYDKLLTQIVLKYQHGLKYSDSIYAADLT